METVLRVTRRGRKEKEGTLRLGIPTSHEANCLIDHEGGSNALDSLPRLPSGFEVSNEVGNVQARDYNALNEPRRAQDIKEGKYNPSNSVSK